MTTATSAHCLLLSVRNSTAAAQKVVAARLRGLIYKSSQFTVSAYPNEMICAILDVRISRPYKVCKLSF